MTFFEQYVSADSAAVPDTRRSRGQVNSGTPVDLTIFPFADFQSMQALPPPSRLSVCVNSHCVLVASATRS